MIVSGCKKEKKAEPEPTPTPTPTTPAAPTITLKSDAGYIFADKSVAKGSMVKFGIVGAGTDITNLKITVSYDGKAAASLLDSTLSSVSSLSVDKSYSASTALGTEKYTFTVTDKTNQTTTKSVTITTITPAGDINTYSAKLMGAQGAAAGSFFATTTGTVYTQANAASNSSIIDILYYYGATNEATLAAPSDALAGTIFNNSSTGLQTWAKRNETKFATTTISSSDFENIKDDALFTQSPSVTYSNKLAVGNVVAFKTETGKKGLVRVDKITTGASGDITITVKVQK